MRIATWNVNSIRQRTEHVLNWLKTHEPDVLCLQEIKCQDEAFPRQVFEDAGYHCAVHGQKTFNGVALLSKLPIEDVTPRLPGMNDDAHARYLEAIVFGSEPVRVASVYAPNGNPPGSDKFLYKLAWLDMLHQHAHRLLMKEELVVLTGDFNIIPENKDTLNPKYWVNDALFQPEAKAAYRKLTHLGFTDAFRALEPDTQAFTFWDYTAGAWQKNNGLRIDFAFLSPQATDKLQKAWIDSEPRGWEKPSDHVPFVVDMNI